MNYLARRNLVHNCPLTATWAAIGGKWKMTIIYWLAETPRHFAALRRKLNDVSDGISEKVLTQQLSELVADGIITRRSTGAIPAPVVYSLSEYGNSVLPMLEAVKVWGARHLERTRAASGNAQGEMSCMAVRSLEDGLIIQR
nr:helix-turn-helix domain-containing protein [Rhodanobacter sp. C03]